MAKAIVTGVEATGNGEQILEVVVGLLAESDECRLPAFPVPFERSLFCQRLTWGLFLRLLVVGPLLWTLSKNWYIKIYRDPQIAQARVGKFDSIARRLK